MSASPHATDPTERERSAGLPADATSAPRRRRGLPVWLRLVLAFAVIAVAVGVIWSVVMRQAPSPTDLIGRFADAGVVCTTVEPISDFRTAKSAGCVTAGEVISVFTYAGQPALDEELQSWCGLKDPMQPTTGAYVLTDHALVLIEGPATSTPATVADQLVTVLGGTAGTYDCATLAPTP